MNLSNLEPLKPRPTSRYGSRSQIRNRSGPSAVSSPLKVCFAPFAVESFFNIRKNLSTKQPLFPKGLKLFTNPQSNGATVESFGIRLKREREKKNITLDDISLSTKIGTRLLRALEEEHFDQLPGGIFNKGFVRAYARCLGMDEDQAVADYLLASGEASPMKAPEPAILAVPEEKPQSPASGVEQIPWGVLAGALLVIAFGFAIWGFNSREKQREAREQSVLHSQVASATSTEQAPTPSASTATASTPAPAAVPAVTPATAPVNPGEFNILIKARDDSWLSITADDKPAVEETLAAGTEKSVPAKKSVAIRAGNAGALDFYFNGKKLPSQGDEGQVKSLIFTENGLEPPKPPATEPTPQPQ